MFRQPKVNGEKLKATSGRGNGTNYQAPDGTRVKLSDKRMAYVQDKEDCAHEQATMPYMPLRKELAWCGKPANQDTRPANINIRTEGPKPAHGGKSFK